MLPRAPATDCELCGEFLSLGRERSRCQRQVLPPMYFVMCLHPTTELVTVDLAKVKVSRIKVKNKIVFEGPANTVLEAFAC